MRSHRFDPRFLVQAIASVRRPRVSFLVTALLASCAAAGAIASTGMIGLDMLRKTFDGAAAKNYGEGYRENADDLFRVIAKPVGENAGKPDTQAGSIPAASPTTAAAGPASAPSAESGTAASAPAGTATAPSSTPPLALEVGLFKEAVVEGKSMPIPVQDGETLYDGFGSHGAGDAIKFMFRANVDAYVYVISIDGTGWIQPIFPGNYSASANPVKANETYLFPEGATWAPLDSYRGVEHLYFIASRSPRPDLEKSLASFSLRARKADPDRAKGGEPPVLAQVSNDAPLTRGFDAPRKSVHEVPATGGEKIAVDSQLFVSNSPGDILVTRWFRHE